MVTQVPSFSLNALPFSTYGFYFKVHDSSGVNLQEPRRRKDWEGRDWFLPLRTYPRNHVTHFCVQLIGWYLVIWHHLAERSWEVWTLFQITEPSYKSGILLLRKRGRRYLERILQSLQQVETWIQLGFWYRGRKGNWFLVKQQQCILMPCLGLWSSLRLVSNPVVSETLIGHPVLHTHSWNLTVELSQAKTHDWGLRMECFPTEICLYFLNF